MAEGEQKFRHISTYIGLANFPILISIGYGIAAMAGIMGSEFTGVAIAAGVSYVVYVFKSDKPEPPNKSQNSGVDEQS